MKNALLISNLQICAISEIQKPIEYDSRPGRACALGLIDSPSLEGASR
jgi:hypothetical protein